MPPDPMLVAAKESLHEKLRADPDFTGIGLTKVHVDTSGIPVDAIYVMLKYDEMREPVPRTWEGFPVKVAVVGTIRADHMRERHEP